MSSLFDLPMERQLELAALQKMTHAEWVADVIETKRLFAEHEAKMDGYMDEESSRRFLRKMMSATQDVD